MGRHFRLECLNVQNKLIQEHVLLGKITYILLKMAHFKLCTSVVSKHLEMNGNDLPV